MATVESSLAVPKSWTELHYGPEIPFLDIRPKELKVETQTETHIPIFIAILFMMAKW